MTGGGSAPMMPLLDAPQIPSQQHLDDLIRRADQQAARLQIQVRAARLEAHLRLEASRPLDAGTYTADGPPPVVTTLAA